MHPVWLSPYLPAHVTAACKIIAEHVDFLEEDAYRLPDGAWRTRELTLFIDAGSIADRGLEQRLRDLLHAYLLLIGRKPKLPSDATAVIRRWLTTSGREQNPRTPWPPWSD
jgi:hypothetical protein